MTGTYDPDLNLVYFGTGNPSPDFHGDDREGDNLFSNSLLALDADTGAYRWHYQFTPHDVHDWDSTHVPVLADLPIRGQARKVVMVANRNGFFYTHRPHQRHADRRQARTCTRPGRRKSALMDDRCCCLTTRRATRAPCRARTCPAARTSTHRPTIRLNDSSSSTSAKRARPTSAGSRTSSAASGSSAARRRKPTARREPSARCAPSIRPPASANGRSGIPRPARLAC